MEVCELTGGAVLADLVDFDEALARAWSDADDVLADALRPPPVLTVSEWADRERVLPDTSAEPGRWSTDRVPYMREIMDACSDPKIERVAVMKAAQVGYSEVLLNVLGYFIDQDPTTILVVQITTGEAAKFSKERIDPLIEACPALAGRVAPPKSRDSGNTIESKDFVGGHLGIVGANAPSGLRSRARRVVLFDEVDGYPPSAGEEGDPIELARKRQSTYWNRFELIGSTPTIADLSKIEACVHDSDELRRYHVSCPHCDGLQHLQWGGRDASYGIKWNNDLSEVGYLCEHCATLIDDRHKLKMLARGQWIADVAHSSPRRVAFHIPGIVSPWVSWSEIVREWHDAQGHPTKLQVFVNTRLGETWDHQGATVDDGTLLARRETYPAEPVPEGVVLVTAGVDVQNDRLEAEFVGWGIGEESWSLDYIQIHGDPSTPDLWEELDRLVVRRTFDHPSGARLLVSATAVDSGGHHTQSVYRFAKDRMAQNVWAIKGMAGEGRPIMGRPSRRNKLKVPLYPVGVDVAKALVYGRLRIERPKDVDGPVPGYCHFPARHPYDEEYFRQLTAEKMVLTQSKNGRHKREWKVRHGRRNEALDVRVYATAAQEGLIAMGWRMGQLAQALSERAEADDDAPPTEDEDDWATGGGRWGNW